MTLSTKTTLVLNLRMTTAMISTIEVLARADLAASTLNYWVDQGHIRPTPIPGMGHRYLRYWTPDEAVAVRAMKVLRDAGCPMTFVANVLDLITLGPGEPDHTLLHWDNHSLSWASPKAVKRIKVPTELATVAVFLPIFRWKEEVLANVVHLSPPEIINDRIQNRQGRSDRAKTS